MEELKRCTRCNKNLPIIGNFDINDYHADGSPRFHAYCKKCRAEKFHSMPLVGKLFHQIQISSKKGKLKNQKMVSKEELGQVIKSQIIDGILYCAATGVKLVHDITSNPLQPSVDRINCSKGYELGNIRIVACTYNLMRRTWDDKVVIEAIIQMAASIDKRVGQK